MVLRHDAALGFVDPEAARRGRRLGRVLWLLMLAPLVAGLLTGCGPAPALSDEGGPAPTAPAGPAMPSEGAAPDWLLAPPGLRVVDGELAVVAVGTSLANVPGPAEAQSASVARSELPDPLARVLTGAATIGLAPRRARLALDDAALDAALAAQVRDLLTALTATPDLSRSHRLANGRVVTLAVVPLTDLVEPLTAGLTGLLDDLARAGQLDGDVTAVGQDVCAAAAAALAAPDLDQLVDALDRALATPWPDRPVEQR